MTRRARLLHATTVALVFGALIATPARAAPDFDLPAVELRIALDRALGEHAFLVIEAMRTGVAGGEEFEVVAAVAEENTTEIVALVEQVYGADAGAQFGEHWRNHIAYLVDYTRAVANADEDAQEVASSQLSTYVEDFSHFLATANPLLPEDVVAGLIGEHRQQLAQIASLGEGEFAATYEALRATYAHMYTIGDGLALAIVGQFPDRFTGQATAFSPAVDVRLTLDRLLGEHTFLAATAMRARLTEADDLEAAVTALDANSAAIAEQIEAIYGADAAAAYDALWGSHIDHYLAYVDAHATGDGDAAERALADLEEYRSDFGSFLAGANPFLDAAGLEDLLATHTDQLVAQVVAYADEDYATAYEVLREAYGHTAELAAGLGGAIADQFPQQFPDTALEHRPGGREVDPGARSVGTRPVLAPVPV